MVGIGAAAAGGLAANHNIDFDAQIETAINPAQQVIGRNVIVEIE